MAAIVGRPKTFMAVADDTREADALDFASDTVGTTRMELTKKKKTKSLSTSSSRLEQLRRERTEREAASSAGRPIAHATALNDAKDLAQNAWAVAL
ncbi:hypothetical protein SDRG_16353 [Saprolegnia diclina VS20]|uniref:Uncharacterized protein n=1 Tax=Saprolegnia diclina (strain VS20) TaxID=1156394 RepID=T0PXJ8_SAPDV|nr:hypothetical protein SDRG_16353 [Saprolegnia diclina VS20]EQC25755.1 hypothetical protein SDRG_16353 [Saprolegnia diclina VS20]|eukprot:XP_008620780.1 hypothetical protein SDRG_16353 [Saprolegnia diclina VS20]